jgi:hypothetical protein
MTPEEFMLQYAECTEFVEENIVNISNQQLSTLINQSNAIQTASIKQYSLNMENEKKSNQEILDIYDRMSKKMKLTNKEHSKDDVVTLNSEEGHSQRLRKL